MPPLPPVQWQILKTDNNWLRAGHERQILTSGGWGLESMIQCTMYIILLNLFIFWSVLGNCLLGIAISTVSTYSCLFLVRPWQIIFFWLCGFCQPISFLLYHYNIYYPLKIFAMCMKKATVLYTVLSEQLAFDSK